MKNFCVVLTSSLLLKKRDEVVPFRFFFLTSSLVPRLAYVFIPFSVEEVLKSLLDSKDVFCDTVNPEEIVG